VSVADPNARHHAPGGLELVRQFLNTWEFVTKTGEPRDLLPALIRDRDGFRRAFGAPAPRTAAERRELIALRGELRGWLDGSVDESALNAWLRRQPLAPRVAGGRIEHVPLRNGLVGLVLANVVDALAADLWPRLKACHDCQFVYFDHTRNGSRRWCMMARGSDPDGRSCGTIAKVRRYRTRQRTQAVS
jgi:hypothetical protein